MGKYSSFMREPERKKPRSVHPIWRGIGFIFMVITPFLGYFGTVLFIQENDKMKWMTIPRDLIASGRDPYLYIKIIGTIAIVFVLYALFMVVTFFIYRLIGPSRYGPRDVPQATYHGKKYKR